LCPRLTTGLPFSEDGLLLSAFLLQQAIFVSLLLFLPESPLTAQKLLSDRQKNNLFIRSNRHIQKQKSHSNQ
jgi:hypothetical protein